MVLPAGDFRCFIISLTFRDKNGNLSGPVQEGKEHAPLGLLKTFYQSYVASVLVRAVVCWWGGIKPGEVNGLNVLVRRARSVVGLELDSPERLAKRRMKGKIQAISDNPSQPLHNELWQMGSTFFTCPSCDFRRSSDQTLQQRWSPSSH